MLIGLVGDFNMEKAACRDCADSSAAPGASKPRGDAPPGAFARPHPGGRRRVRGASPELCTGRPRALPSALGGAG